MVVVNNDIALAKVMARMDIHVYASAHLRKLKVINI